MLTVSYSKQYKVKSTQYESFKKEFIKSTVSDLKEIEAFVDVDENSIKFERESKNLAGRRDIFKIMKRGEIDISNDENNALITVKVEIHEHLYFSILAGILFSFALGVNVDFNLNFIINSTLIISAITFLGGYLKVKLQIHSIIKRNILYCQRRIT